MKTIDREACRTISADVSAALQAVADRHGLSLTVGGGSFSSTEFKPKVEFQVKTEGGVPATFAREAKMFGLPDGCFGKEFVAGGTAYRITGIEVRRHKMPVSAVRVSDGKGFKFPADRVAFALGVRT